MQFLTESFVIIHSFYLFLTLPFLVVILKFFKRKIMAFCINLEENRKLIKLRPQSSHNKNNHNRGPAFIRFVARSDTSL